MIGPHPTGFRRGYTLIEMLVSASSMGVIMTGIASAILLASQSLRLAVDPNDNDMLVSAGTQSALFVLTQELSVATTVVKDGATGVLLIISDRDGDGSDEIVRYSWSGKAGDPLKRQCNFDTPHDILSGVSEFSMKYAGPREANEPNGVESIESLLFCYPTLGSSVSLTDIADFSVNPAKWLGQYFVPNADPNATGFTITRASYLTRCDSDPNGQMFVRIRKPTAGGLPDPNSEPNLATSLLGSSLPTASFIWYEAWFSSSPCFTPVTSGVCLTVEQDVAPPSSAIIYAKTGAPTGEGSTLLKTVSGKSSWTALDNQSMFLRVMGKQVLPSSAAIGGQPSRTCVYITLRAGLKQPLYTAVTILNSKEDLGS